jgi:hypothetical protein
MQTLSSNPGVSERIPMELKRDNHTLEEIVDAMSAKHRERSGCGSIVGGVECRVGASVELHAHQQREGSCDNRHATAVDISSTGPAWLASTVTDNQNWHNDDGSNHRSCPRLASQSSKPPSIFCRKPVAGLHIRSTACNCEFFNLALFYYLAL